MVFSRRHRQTLCRWLVGMWLAMQWLVAAQACAAGVHGWRLAGGGAAEATTSMLDANAADCHQVHAAGAHAHLTTVVHVGTPLDAGAASPPGPAPAWADTAAPCKAHCTASQQVPADAPAPSLVPHLCGWWIVQLPFSLPFALPTALPTALPHALAMAATLAQAQGGAPPPGWPPLYIAHAVLRN